jgi:hypothetical protein
MSVDEKIKKKFDSLLTEGMTILQRAGWNGSRYDRHPDDIEYHRWKNEALNLLAKSCGTKSNYYQQLLKFTEGDLNTNSYYFKDCYGIVQAAQKDYIEGLTEDLRSLVEAEVFEDLLTQAEHLLGKGYSCPAASLAGGVLENALRSLCDKNGITYKEDADSINSLNTKLRKKEVYSKHTFKEITAKADIRNNADHGKFKEVKKADVKDMIRWIGRFLEETS